MSDSWKSIDFNKFVVNDDMIDYVLHKYGNNWQRIEKDVKHLNKAKEKMDLNKGTKNMVMERVTFNESSDHSPFQVNTNDTLKSSSEDTCSSDSTWEQKKVLKWYDDLCLDEQRTVYNGRAGSSSRNATTTKREKPKSSSKHLAPTTPRTGSTSTTLFVPIKRPPPVTNYALGLAAVKTWQQIPNKKFGIKKAKEDVGGSSDVRRKGKRKML
ncbi:hypothetical protein Tco_1554603 [Tanacetum coccineum]